MPKDIYDDDQPIYISHNYSEDDALRQSNELLQINGIAAADWLDRTATASNCHGGGRRHLLYYSMGSNGSMY